MKETLPVPSPIMQVAISKKRILISSRRLKGDGRVFKHDTIQHAYPYCERSDTPLIYKAVPARFIRVEQLRDRMVEHNKTIHWVPGAVGHKRFGNWIADAA